MPMTPTYGFEYETPLTKPGITLTGDSDGSSPILAEQVETALAGIDSRLAAAEGDISVLQTASAVDTGWVSLSVTASGGYSVTTNQYRRWGPVASVNIVLTRTGGNFTANSAGNVTDTPLCTINTTEVRPSVQTFCLIQTTSTSGAALIGINGVVTITDMHANSVIATDDVVRITQTYFVSTFS
jgi:hypothetical protein